MSGQLFTQKHMQKIFFLIAVLFTALNSIGQKVNGKLTFQQGQSYDIAMDLKNTISQEAMGNAIDFTVDGTAIHAYKVTNTTQDNSTLHHEMKRIKFNFEGMGPKISFDSDNPKDMAGQLGTPIKETMKQTYDIAVDPAGKVLMVQPEKMQTVEMDERLKIITNLIKDVLDVVQPPQKGTASLFKVLPDHEVGQGDTWTETYENEAGKFNNVYTLNSITDSTIVVDLNGTSNTISKLEIMAGMEVITKLNNKTTGKIILDKATGIVRQKTTTTESNGTTAAMGSETPITSKSAITIRLSPGK